MILTIDVDNVKKSRVLALLRDMERLDLLRVTAGDTAPATPAKSEERDRKLFELHAERLNAEALDVLSYQSLDL